MTGRILPCNQHETQNFATIQGKNRSLIPLPAKSRDAKSCVSQVGKSNIVNALLCACIAMGSTGDARFCVSTGLAPCYQKRSAESVSSPLRDAKC